MKGGGHDSNVLLPPELQVAKHGTRSLIRAVGGTVEAGEIVDRHQSRMARYGLPNTPDFIPIDAVMALEAVTHGAPGHPHVTRILARSAGYALVKLPSAHSGSSDWHRALGGLSREVGQVVERVCEVLSDQETPGEVTAFEVREKNIVGEIDDAIEKLVEMRGLAAQALEAE